MTSCIFEWYKCTYKNDITTQNKLIYKIIVSALIYTDQAFARNIKSATLH